MREIWDASAHAKQAGSRDGLTISPAPSATSRDRAGVNQTGDERQRNLTIVRRTFPVLTVVVLWLCVPFVSRYWFIGIAVGLMLCYLAILLIAKHAEAGRRAELRPPGQKK